MPAQEHEQGSVQGALYGARALASGEQQLLTPGPRPAAPTSSGVHPALLGSVATAGVAPIAAVRHPLPLPAVRCRADPTCAPVSPSAHCPPPWPDPAAGTGPLLFAALFAAFTRTDSPLPYFPGEGGDRMVTALLPTCFFCSALA